MKAPTRKPEQNLAMPYLFISLRAYTHSNAPNEALLRMRKILRKTTSMKFLPKRLKPGPRVSKGLQKLRRALQSAREKTEEHAENSTLHPTGTPT